MNGKFKVIRGSVSRKTNELANKKDVMRRLHIQSSQEVRARLELFKPKKRKKISRSYSQIREQMSGPQIS